jgi:hypothetical protein
MHDWPSIADALGWLAAALMLMAFSSTHVCRMRACAVAANLAFVAYGLAAHLPPVLILHLLLLPINALRLARAVGRPQAARVPA